MSYTVQNVIDKVSQDIRLQLASTIGSTGAPILIDYTDRIQKQMLRFSRWQFVLAPTQYFMTVKGQTEYWLGTAATLPEGTVDTGLHLVDVERMKKDSFVDISNIRKLTSQFQQPFGWGLNFASGQSRPAPPRVYWHDINNPFLLHIYPAADNANTFQPVPQPPILSSSVGGSLSAQTVFVRLTFVDSIGGESVGSVVSTSWNVPANSLLNVSSPSLLFEETDTGVSYNFYNVYAGPQEGSETLQNATPITMGVNWLEPTSGLITTGRSVPSSSTIATMGGYIIQFRYYTQRTTLSTVTQVIQIPDEYIDVIVSGVSALGWMLTGKLDLAQAAKAEFQQGLVAMIWDKNLFPDTDFVRPDVGSFVNQQVLGILPSEF